MYTGAARVRLGLRIALLSSALLACDGDAACILYPCPLPIAATITVSAASAPAGILGLTMAVNGAAAQEGLCSSGPTTTCSLYGGRGSYHVDLRAPGYLPAELNLTITGVDAACNTCGHLDSQTRSVVMQPAGLTTASFRRGSRQSLLGDRSYRRDA